jgi:hypothetical protein
MTDKPMTLAWNEDSSIHHLSRYCNRLMLETRDAMALAPERHSVSLQYSTCCSNTRSKIGFYATVHVPV